MTTYTLYKQIKKAKVTDLKAMGMSAKEALQYLYNKAPYLFIGGHPLDAKGRTRQHINL